MACSAVRRAAAAMLLLLLLLLRVPVFARFLGGDGAAVDMRMLSCLLGRTYTGHQIFRHTLR